MVPRGAFQGCWHQQAEDEPGMPLHSWSLFRTSPSSGLFSHGYMKLIQLRQEHFGSEAEPFLLSAHVRVQDAGSSGILVTWTWTHGVGSISPQRSNEFPQSLQNEYFLRKHFESMHYSLPIILPPTNFSIHRWFCSATTIPVLFVRWWFAICNTPTVLIRSLQ